MRERRWGHCPSSRWKREQRARAAHFRDHRSRQWAPEQGLECFGHNHQREQVRASAVVHHRTTTEWVRPAVRSCWLVAAAAAGVAEAEEPAVAGAEEAVAGLAVLIGRNRRWSRQSDS